MKARYLLVLCVTLVVAWLGLNSTVLAVPGLINYQGILTDPMGERVTGTYTMRFVLYDLTGSPAWNEEQSVVVRDGIYNVQLGTANPLTSDLFQADEAYLGVEIYNPETEMWEYLSPRQRLTSAAYASQAENARSLEGYGSGDFATLVHEHSGGDITTGTVGEARIDPDIARDSEITWSHLSGIPADIADGDQVGITTETDPTITDPSVKDGVSWSELSGIPGGFADGEDNIGLTEGSDYGRSGVASTLYEGTIALSTKYVGKSGSQTITNGNLTVNTSYGVGESAVTGVKGFAQSDTFGFGVIGEATGSQGYGVYGRALGTIGKGVYGSASSVGVYGEASNGWGTGVQGVATNTGNYENCGGYFIASGLGGRGVYGSATGNIGTGVLGVAWSYEDFENYGGIFLANGSYGRGVSGHASNQGNFTNYGGKFLADGSYGRGVYGEASDPGDFTNHGGFFTANGTLGRGIYAEGANTGDVRNFGGYFRVKGRDGWGVYAEAQGTNGIAVYAKSSYSTGFDFYAGGAGGNYIPFTGAHEVRFALDTHGEIRAGMIVSVTGRAEKRIDEDGDITLSSTLPTVTVTRKAMDRAVLGVLVSQGPLPDDHWYHAQEGERFGVVNALGEGRM